MASIRLNLAFEDERDDLLIADLSERSGKLRAQRVRQLAYLGLVLERAGNGLAGLAALAGQGAPAVQQTAVAGAAAPDGGGSNRQEASGTAAANEAVSDQGSSFDELIDEAAESSWGDIASV